MERQCRITLQNMQVTLQSWKMLARDGVTIGRGGAWQMLFWPRGRLLTDGGPTFVFRSSLRSRTGPQSRSLCMTSYRRPCLCLCMRLLCTVTRSW